MRWADLASTKMLFGHRGASIELPENTLPAFQRALELGANALELDVHATNDGVFVVSHDPTGERMCNTLRKIGDSPWGQVSTWDAGWGFVDEHGKRPYANRGFRVPRLEEVVKRFRETPLNIDVKAADSHAIAHLIALLRAHAAEERVLLTSFSWQTLREIRREGYRGPTGLAKLDVTLLLFSPELLGRLVRFDGKRVQVPVRSGPFDLSRKTFIDKCHGLGLAVDYWVVNDATLAKTLLERGADGIITDDPRRIAPAFAEYAPNSVR